MLQMFVVATVTAIIGSVGGVINIVDGIGSWYGTLPTVPCCPTPNAEC